MISIIPSDNNLTEQALALAKQWGFNFLERLPQHYNNSHYLQLTPLHLQLVQYKEKFSGPIYVDFTAGQTAHRRLFGGGKGQTIAKAVGLNKLSQPVILDATAGMGKDAFIFAALGARVILMERSPIAAALLSDGLQRAAVDKDIADIINNMTFLFADTLQLNNTMQLNETPDIIYLDPMFPHRKKSALVKKEMLAFQSLIGDDNDSNELLEISRKIADKRVVVKRPIKAPFLDNCKPSYSMAMKKHRFDIYITC